MLYDPFNVLLNSVCLYLVEDFCTYVTQGYWPVILKKSFWGSVFGTLCFLDLDIYFLPWIREVSSHYFFKWIFYPFLSSPFQTSIMQMLVYLMLSQMSLKLSSFSLILFTFTVLIGWFPLCCPPGWLRIILYHLYCYWFPTVYFSF